MSFGSKERASVIFVSALALATLVGEAKPAFAGGENSGPYCESAVKSSEPFDRARHYWGMSSLEDEDNHIRILLCGSRRSGLARIDVTPGLKDYLRIINGGFESLDKIEEGENLLSSSGYRVTGEWKRGFSGFGVFSRLVDIGK